MRKWLVPVYNREEQLVARLTVSATNRTEAEHKAEDYVEAKYPRCWINYSEIEFKLEEIQVQDIEIA